MKTFHRPAEGGPLVDLGGGEVPAGGWVWVDLEVGEREAIERLAETHGWDRMSLENVFDDTPLALLADFGDHLFVVLQTLGPAGARVSTVEVDAFLGERLLVTVRHGPVPALDTLIEASQRTAGLTEGGPDRMLARVSAAITSPFLTLLDRLELRIEELEERAVVRDPSVIQDIQTLRSDVTRLRRLVAPVRDVLLSLSREGASPLIATRARHRFADGYDQVFRTVESLDGARLLLAAALETYRSAVAEDMNGVMKVLTVFSAIVLPLTLLAGIWGMNFAHMPELEARWGYFGALAVMVLVGIVMWTWFARRGYVGGPRLRHLPRAIGSGLWEVAQLPVKGFEKVIRSTDDPGSHPRSS